MKKILIVDDDVDIIDLVVNRLKNNNYDVIYANDGDNAIKKALEEKPDLIIMDVMMPQLNGGDAVKLLRTYDNTKNIPVIFFTAMNSFLPNGVELSQINVNGELFPAITKPFESTKLLASIKSLLNE